MDANLAKMCTKHNGKSFCTSWKQRCWMKIECKGYILIIYTSKLVSYWVYIVLVKLSLTLSGDKQFFLQSWFFVAQSKKQVVQWTTMCIARLLATISHLDHFSVAYGRQAMGKCHIEWNGIGIFATLLPERHKTFTFYNSQKQQLVIKIIQFFYQVQNFCEVQGHTTHVHQYTICMKWCIHAVPAVTHQ